MPKIGRHISRLSGYAPALPTPFDQDGRIDKAAFENFCRRQIHEGATALVVCGTTGEAPTLTPEEHQTLIRIAAGVACGQVPVIAGAGSNSTSHAIELTKDAEAAGADGILSVVPYYQGGHGCISVTSNVAPGLCWNMFLACRQGQIATAQRWAATFAKLTAALFRETSPLSAQVLTEHS